MNKKTKQPLTEDETASPEDETEIDSQLSDDEWILEIWKEKRKHTRANGNQMNLILRWINTLQCSVVSYYTHNWHYTCMWVLGFKKIVCFFSFLHKLQTFKKIITCSQIFKRIFRTV